MSALGWNRCANLKVGVSQLEVLKTYNLHMDYMVHHDRLVRKYAIGVSGTFLMYDWCDTCKCVHNLQLFMEQMHCTPEHQAVCVLPKAIIAIFDVRYSSSAASSCLMQRLCCVNVNGTQVTYFRLIPFIIQVKGLRNYLLKQYYHSFHIYFENDTFIHMKCSKTFF